MKMFTPSEFLIINFLCGDFQLSNSDYPVGYGYMTADKYYILIISVANSHSIRIRIAHGYMALFTERTA